MAGKSLTRVQGGVTDTININNDKFAGVRTMTSGYEYPADNIPTYNQSNFSLTKTDNRNFRVDSNLGNDGVGEGASGNRYVNIKSQGTGLRLGKHRLTFDVTLNNDSSSGAATVASDISNFMFRFSHRDSFHNKQPVEGSNTFDFEITDDGIYPQPKMYFAFHTNSVYDISISNLKLVHNYEEHTVDRTVSSGVSTLTSGYVYPKIAAGSFNNNGVNFRKLPHGNADEKTFSIVANNSTADKYISLLNSTSPDGIRLGKHRLECDVTLNSGSLSSITGYYKDPDDDTSTSPSATYFNFVEGSNVIDFELFDDGDTSQPRVVIRVNSGSTCDISITNLKITHNYGEHTVDRFPSGVRTLEVTRPLTDETTQIQVTVAGHSDLDGVYTTFNGLASGGADKWLQEGGDGEINAIVNEENNITTWFVLDADDYDPQDYDMDTTWFGEGVVDRPWKSLTNYTPSVTITSVPDTLTLDRSSQPPLLSKISGGASAAYSLRDLNDKQGNSKVVRVRRKVDSQERDFIAKDIGKPLEDWVAGKLDTKLPADFKDSSGNSLASGAYSLRKVKADYEGPAVDLTIAQKYNGSVSNSSCSIGFDRNNEVSLDSPVISGSYKDGQTLRDLVKPNRLDYGFANYSRSSVQDKSTNLSFETLDDKGNFNYTLTNNQSDHSFYLYIGGQYYTAGSYELTGSIKVSYNQLGTQQVNFHWGWGINRSFGDPTNGNGGTVYEFTEDNPLRIERSRAGFAGPFIYNNSDVRVDNLYVEVRNLQVKVVSQAANVNKWYDQSGNNNHLENTVYAEQPVLVEKTGELVRDRNGKVAISDKSYVWRNADGTNRQDYNEQWNHGTCLKFPEGANMLSSDGSYSMFAVMDLDDQTQSLNNFNDVVRMWSYSPPSGSPRKPQLYLPNTHGGLDVTGPSYSQGSVHINKSMAMSKQLFVNIADPSETTKSNTIRTDGVLMHSKDDATIVNNITSIRGTHGIFDEGEKHSQTFISEFIYYPSNQKLNEFSIESNINNHWNMFTPQSNGDGHVSLWYDQSSYGNDVAQPTIHYQPRLVIDGQLSRTPDGKPAVKFSENTYLIASANAQGLLSNTGHSSSFVIAAHGGDLSHHTWHNHWTVISTEYDPNRYGINRRPYIFRSYSTGYMALTHDSGGGPIQPMDDDTTALFTSIIRGHNNSETLAAAAISKNGGPEQVSTKVWQAGSVDRKLHKGTGLSFAKIGARYTDGRGPFEQWIVEIIHYASDQTANAPALNANIINQYEL